MEALFENNKFKITYYGQCENDVDSKTHRFNIYIKDFNAPILNLGYDDNEDVIIRTWIEDKDEDNGPKGHIIYKLFSLIEFEVCEVMKFIIRHI
ncbi:MAG: hypothetical protein ACRCXA_13140 [Peptostreptococcaceae bacterium]